jgi:serine/threonine protein kinase
MTETLQTPVMELSIGSTFAGRYQIIEELGRGGMGNVYKALDKELGERVALKLLKPEIASDDRMIERFRNELKFARKITHKNVCRMFDLSKTEKTPYITMEYVSGEDLKSSLRRMGPLHVGKAIFIAKQVCEGLGEAHKLGVIHRDLKPQNIMIDKQGYAHIMDFGIARSTKAKGVTTSGMMIGTPDYMSPEQVEGKDVDQRADIYAMGVILYEMVTGSTPFHGDTAITIALKHTREKPRDPRELNDQIPVELSRMILKCMEKDKAKRYQKTEELFEGLDKIEQFIPTTDRVSPVSKPSTARTILRRPKVKKIFVPALVIIGLAIVALVVWRFTPLPEIIGIKGPSMASSPADSYIKAANQYWKEKKYPESYGQFSKALEVDPNNLEAQFGLADSLKEQGKLDEAIPEYEKAISLNDEDPRAYGQLGLVFEQKKEVSKALDYFKQYLTRAPRGQDFDVVSQKVKDLEAQVQAASTRRRVSDQTRLASQQEKKEPQTKPKEKPPQRGQEKPDITAKVDRGISLFNQEDYDGCIKQMQEVLRTDPRNTSAQYFLSEAKKRKSEIEKEQEINNRLRLAQSAYQTGDYQECISQAQEVLNFEPGNASALNLINEAKKKVDEKSREQQIRDGLQRAQQAYQRENYQECLTQARSVLDLDPGNARAQEFINSANEKISQTQINSLVNQYVQSVNNGNLLIFYENNCSSQCFLEIKKDAEIITTYFSNLQSSASNIEIRFKDTNQAEVSFYNTISGTNKAGAKQDVIKGVYRWDLEKQGNIWKIIGITSPRG